MDEIPRQVVETRGGRISFREAGSGPALFLAHGIGGNSQSWRFQFSGLSGKLRLVAWDAPGYGESGPRTPTLAGYAAAVVDLLDALEIETAHVLGHSMGGLVAQGVAGLYDARVSKLILSSTFSGDGEPIDKPLAGVWKARLDERASMSDAEFGSARAAGMVARGASAKVHEEVAMIAGKVTHGGLEGGCLLLYHADTRALARSFSMPVLSITGREDTVIPRARSDEVADLIVGCQTLEIPGVGHAAYFEDPEAYNTSLSDFLF